MATQRNDGRRVRQPTAVVSIYSLSEPAPLVRIAEGERCSRDCLCYNSVFLYLPVIVLLPLPPPPLRRPRSVHLRQTGEGELHPRLACHGGGMACAKRPLTGGGGRR